MQKKSFTLENSLYNEVYISQAIADFGDNFSLSYEEEILIISWEDAQEIQMIFDEFMNYVLALSNE